MIVANDLTELIGHSPVLRVKTARPDWDVFLKLESFNPSGSFKDRTAWGLISAAEERGVCKPGTTIVESSSGNTAKALAMLAAARGYEFIAVVDKHAPADKLSAIRVYGC